MKVEVDNKNKIAVNSAKEKSTHAKSERVHVVEG